MSKALKTTSPFDLILQMLELDEPSLRRPGWDDHRRVLLRNGREWSLPGIGTVEDLISPELTEAIDDAYQTIRTFNHRPFDWPKLEVNLREVGALLLLLNYRLTIDDARSLVGCTLIYQQEFDLAVLGIMGDYAGRFAVAEARTGENRPCSAATLMVDRALALDEVSCRKSDWDAFRPAFVHNGQTWFLPRVGLTELLAWPDLAEMIESFGKQLASVVDRDPWSQEELMAVKGSALSLGTRLLEANYDISHEYAIILTGCTTVAFSNSSFIKSVCEVMTDSFKDRLFLRAARPLDDFLN
jgi:hypothetical protein